MTQSIESIIEVLQAYKDGKKIEYSRNNGKTWTEFGIPSWNFSVCEYRIAPEPKKKMKLEAWLINNQLFWFADRGGSLPHWIRVPSEDKEIEV